MAGGTYGLLATVRRRAGNAGVETFAAGTKIIHIFATGPGGQVVMPKGDGTNTIAVPMSAVPFDAQFLHECFVLQGSGALLQLNFQGTSSYFVEYVTPSEGE